ncbi:hypothetical protein CALCODRAFT_408223, partial [Calocera cornea HHB12733]
KRKKVGHACLYCRRSHMTCDEGAPCQRCIKREIGHLCHDDPKVPPNGKHSQSDTPPAQPVPTSTTSTTSTSGPSLFPSAPADLAGGMAMTQQQQQRESFCEWVDFLETLDDRTFFNSTPTLPSLTPGMGPQATTTPLDSTRPTASPSRTQSQTDLATYASNQNQNQDKKNETITAIPGATKDERYLLTAADQEPGTRDERLARVIRAKYEAGLLRPFNYVVGYQRLTRWMEKHVSPESKSAVQQALSSFRPAFRAIAQGLRDIDLVFIEEAFERLLLDYDRVFSVMGVPACLWRRTGEIYKGNKEFADLVGLPHELLREGRLCIYELMAEESSKYGQIAFDLAQKAVLTTCVLRYKPNLSTTSGASSRPPTAINKRKRDRDRERERLAREEQMPEQERFINCCFSFTIRRDLYGIPVMVVGNFLKC